MSEKISPFLHHYKHTLVLCATWKILSYFHPFLCLCACDIERKFSFFPTKACTYTHKHMQTIENGAGSSSIQANVTHFQWMNFLLVWCKSTRIKSRKTFIGISSGKFVYIMLLHGKGNGNKRVNQCAMCHFQNSHYDLLSLCLCLSLSLSRKFLFICILAMGVWWIYFLSEEINFILHSSTLNDFFFVEYLIFFWILFN